MDGPGGTGTGTGTSSAPGSGWIWDQVQVEGPADMDQAIHLQPPIAGGDDSLSSSVSPDPASSFLPRTMSNADFDALLHNYTAAGAGAPPSSMMTFDQNVDPQANDNKSDPIATAAADASTAAAVAALQANGLINPLRPNSSGASGSVHGFDWSQDANNNNGNSGYGGDLSMTAPSMRFSNSNNSFASSSLAYDAGRSIGGGYQQGRASWDGASASRTALNQQLAAAARGDSLTPGQESSDSGGNTSTASTKRRRMTFSGVDSSHQAGRGRPPGHGAAIHHQHQQQPESSAIHDDDDDMRSLSNAWGRAAPAAPLPPFSTSAGGSNHVVNSRDLEAMAAETLQRASAENSRSIDGAGNLSAMPASIAPGLAHHQQHHHQQRQRQQPRSQAAKGSGPIYAGDSSAGQSSSAPTYVSSQQASIGNNTNSHAAASANAHAHAHAHPSSSLAPTTTTTTLLRAGQDGSPSASSGAQAAHEFTRRKGWAHRVVDELLDFSFVLSPDQEARIVHATNSVHGITGWKADSLKGESLFSFIHPQDAPALQRQLARSLETGEDMLLYYRFRRNPATIAARAKVRLAKENGAAGGAAGAGAGAGGQRQARSPSAAMSSSADSSTTPSDEYGAGARGGKPHPASVGEVDPDADWVTFEMSGHVYHVPVDVDPSRDEVAGAREEEDEGSTGNSNSNSNDSSMTTKSRSTGSATANPKLEEASNDGSAIYKPASTSSGPVATTSTSSPPRPKKYSLPLPRRSEAQCFFCSCRVYPSKGVTVLDSFLELKLENEKLRRQLEDLNIAEAQGGAAGQDSGEGEAGSKGPFAQAQGRRSSNTPMGSSSASRPGPSVLQGKSKSSGSGGAASKVQSADSVTAVSGSHDRVPTTSEGSAAGRDSLSEAGQILRRKHSTTAAAAAGGGGAAARRKSHEAGSAQSHSLGTPSNSTGGAITATGTGTMSSSGASPPLPASTSMGGSSAAGAALEEDRVCTDCGRTDSPEWRKGPLGPKTLCNACGLRYAKRVKKKAQAHAQVQGAVHGNLVGGGGQMQQHGLPLGETMGVGAGEEMGMDGLTAGAGGGGGGAPQRMTTPRVPSNGAVLAHSPTPARRASGHAGMIYAGSAGGGGSDFASPSIMAAQLSQQSPGSSYVNHQQHQYAHAHAHAHAHGQHGLPHQHQQSPYGPFAHPATATTAARYMNPHPYQSQPQPQPQPQPQQQQYAGMDADLTGAFTSYDPSTGVSFPTGPGGGAGEHQQQQLQGGGLTDGGFGYNLQTQHQPGWGEGR